MRIIIYAIILILLCAGIGGACMSCHAQAATVNVAEKAVSIAKGWVGTVETPTNSNRGKLIDEMHKFHGIPYGNPYCAMTVNYAMFKAHNSIGVKSPLPKIARVSMIYRWGNNNPLTVKMFTPKSIMLGAVTLKPGDMIIWKSGTKSIKENWNGHEGITQKGLPKNQVLTIEGNTMPSSKGDQREGGGIWERTRGYGLGTSFEIVAFMRILHQNYDINYKSSSMK